MNPSYDFKAAQQRRAQLVQTYRTMKRQYEDDGTWSWWLIAQIEEIDREIAEAHAARKCEMTVGQDGHLVVQSGNVYVPIIPGWQGRGKEAVGNV